MRLYEDANAKVVPKKVDILLMAEILHHLGCTKPYQ